MDRHDPGLAAELPQLTDKTLSLLIRACELALQAYELLMPEVGEKFVHAEQCRTTLATALRERERRNKGRIVGATERWR